MKIKSIEIVIFSKKQLDRLSKTFNPAKMIIAVALSSAILSIPTTGQPLAQTAIQFAATLALLTATIIITAVAAKALGAENNIKNIISTSGISMMLSLLAISLPAGLITIWLIPLVFHTQLFSSLLFSIIPFYNFLIFGWSVEESSKNKNQTRKTITALFSLTMIMLFYIIISILQV